MKISFSNKYVRYFLLLIALALAGFLSYRRVFDLYELQTYDWRFQLRGARPVSDKIVIIEIGEDSIKKLGAWPFPREWHKGLIDALMQAQAKAILFDVIFSDPKPDDNWVVMWTRLAKNVYYPFAFLDPKLKEGRYISDRIITPLLPSYRRYAKGIGYVNTWVDLDGKRRRTMPMIRYHGKDYLQICFQLAADLLGTQKKDISLIPRRCIQFGKDLKIPLDEESCFIVNYARKWGQGFTHYSYADILKSSAAIDKNEIPEKDLTQLKDKVCIVGLTAVATHDVSSTPLERVYPMVGQYANVLNSILRRDFIRRLTRLCNLGILLVCALLVGIISLCLRPLRALWATAGVIFFFTLTAITLFNLWGLWIDLFYPLVLFSAVYTICTLGRVLSEMRKRQLMENELKIASQIQKSFLPENPPVQPGLSLAAFMQPAKQVGGDLYAFIALADEKMGVMVGDVSGKGTPAALFMAKTVSEFKFVARDNPDPADVLTKLNNAIASESTGGLFVTLCYVIFDHKKGTLLMSNGGHLPMVAVRSGGDAELLLAEEGMPIGVMEGVAFSNFKCSIKPGDCFALYSDGISEARNRKKEEYGVKSLERRIARRHAGTAKDIINETISDVTRFAGKAEQHDDMTLIVVKIEA